MPAGQSLGRNETKCIPEYPVGSSRFLCCLPTAEFYIPSATMEVPVLSCNFDRADEDWTGLSDPKTRRVIQNRINQRKHSASCCRTIAPVATEPEESRDTQIPVAPGFVVA
jgi:hypothetical protein